MTGISAGTENKLVFLFTKIYKSITTVAVAAVILIVTSCTKQSEFDIGKDFIESETRLCLVDTFRVDLSTIIQDSLRTSGTKVALVGSMGDELFGNIKCETYFDLAFSVFGAIEEKAFFDSAAFVLPFTGYSIGDTLSRLTLRIHQLAEKIKTGNDGYLYSINSFAYLPEPISTVTFYPEPNSKVDTTLNFRVDALGEDLFNKIRDKDQNVSSSEWFMDYIRGFVVTPGNAVNKAIIGLNAAENKIALKIYYHLRREEADKKEITISMGEANHQFNHVEYDLSGTHLNNIKSSGNKKMASETANKSYMQGLTGLITKVQFPSLQNIFMESNWKILKAELIIEPSAFSYEEYALPQKLYIYQTDKVNKTSSILKDEKGTSISQLTDEDNNPLTAIFENDKVLGENTRYTFDITSYINKELAGKYFDYRRGLHIGLSQDDYRTTLNRVLFEGKKPPVKLKLYYLSY
ncbi:MAG TPA: DUF4270 family protein [Bacteroidales bacterium]|nr:DUF4270 family protein [Bacteroidales bacterium]